MQKVKGKKIEYRRLLVFTIDYFLVSSGLSVAETTVLIGVKPCLIEGYLKKQSQFIRVQCSVFCGQRQNEEKELEKTKPILSTPKGVEERLEVIGLRPDYEG